MIIQLEKGQNMEHCLRQMTITIETDSKGMPLADGYVAVTFVENLGNLLRRRPRRYPRVTPSSVQRAMKIQSDHGWHVAAYWVSDFGTPPLFTALHNEFVFYPKGAS